MTTYYDQPRKLTHSDEPFLYHDLWRWEIILKSIVRPIINCYICRVLCCFQRLSCALSYLTLITALGDRHHSHFIEKEREPLTVIGHPKSLSIEKWKSWPSNFLTSNSGLLWCTFFLCRSYCPIGQAHFLKKLFHIWRTSYIAWERGFLLAWKIII